jgi:glycosyltransferase involved in cell wall biosynthesis
MKQRYKILILIKSLGLGGAERLIVDSLPYLDQEQFDYTFAYLLPWKAFLVPQFIAAKFPIYCLGAPRTSDDKSTFAFKASESFEPHPVHKPVAGGGWTGLGVIPTAGWRLWKLLQQQQFDLIHADLPLAGILARFIGRWRGVPVIYTEHNLQERYHPLTRWANGLTYGWNKCVLTVSEEVAISANTLGLNRKTRLVTLLNGVPVEQVRAEASQQNGLRAELDIPEHHLIVGTVAVFRRQKRLQDWLDVAAQIAGRREDVTFLLVGDGPEAATIKAKIQMLGLTNRVRLPGFRPDGRRLMGLMDVYLMTSEFEGLPIALLEAMALGKPVVSTAVGGIPELVRPAGEGFLTSVGNINNLTRYTLQLLNDPQRRQQMGQQGAYRVETEFHLRHRVRMIESIYLEVLREANGNTAANRRLLTADKKL